MSFTFGSNNQSHPLLGDGNTTDNKVSSAGALAVGAGTASASVQKLAGVSNVSSNKVPPTALASIPNASPNKVAVNNAALALPNKVVTIGGDSASLSSDSSANSNIASNKINSKVGSAEPAPITQNQNVSNDDDVNIGSFNIGNSSDAISATAVKVAAQTAQAVATKVATTAATSAVASQVANAVSAQLATANQKEGFGTCGMNNDHMWLLWLVIVVIICYLVYVHFNKQ